MQVFALRPSFLACWRVIERKSDELSECLKGFSVSCYCFFCSPLLVFVVVADVAAFAFHLIRQRHSVCCVCSAQIKKRETEGKRPSPEDYTGSRVHQLGSPLGSWLISCFMWFMIWSLVCVCVCVFVVSLVVVYFCQREKRKKKKRRDWSVWYR